MAKRKRGRNGELLRELIDGMARHCLLHGRPESMEGAVEAISRALRERGMEADVAEADLRQAILSSLMLALLMQANAVYGFPYSDREVLQDLLPVWTGIFTRLQRPGLLCQAFQSHYREWEDFPLPARILDILPESAFRRELLQGGKISPGFGRAVCERVKEECRVLRFRKVARKEKLEGGNG